MSQTRSPRLALADIAREDLGDREQVGKGVRPAGLVDRPVPLVKRE